MGVGAVLTPALLTAYIEEHGWHSGYLALGIAVILFAVTAALLLRGGDGDKTLRVTPEPVRTLLFTPSLLPIAALLLLAAIAVLCTTMHIVLMLTDQGMSSAAAGLMASSLGVAVIGGRVITGKLLDMGDAGVVSAGLLLCRSIGKQVKAIDLEHVQCVGDFL
jgi:predicted MFS family arabinose efflux permease